MAHTVNLTTRTQKEADTTVTKQLARCSCGWAGPPRQSRDAARTDGQRHIDDRDGHWGVYPS